MTCICKNWARIPKNSLPISNHAQGCPEYKSEKFMRLTLDGIKCIMEIREAEAMMEEDDSPYQTEIVEMTRDQFDRLDDFCGF